AGNDVNRCASLEKIEDHLPGHFPGVCADPLFRNPMVRGKYVNALPLDPRARGLLNGDHLRSQLFQPAQAAQRLGQMVQVLLGALPPNRIGGLDFADQRFEKTIHCDILLLTFSNCKTWTFTAKGAKDAKESNP